MLVDPGKVTLNFQSSDPPHSPPEVTRRARGVMTVTIRGYPPETKSQYHGVWVGGCEGCGWVWVGGWEGCGWVWVSVGGGCVCILVWASTNCRLKYFTSFLLPLSLPSLLHSQTTPDVGVLFVWVSKSISCDCQSRRSHGTLPSPSSSATCWRTQ